MQAHRQHCVSHSMNFASVLTQDEPQPSSQLDKSIPNNSQITFPIIENVSLNRNLRSKSTGKRRGLVRKMVWGPSGNQQHQSYIFHKNYLEFKKRLEREMSSEKL